MRTFVRIGTVVLVALLVIAITAAFMAFPYPGLSIPESLLRA